ncbi:serine/threonine-protein kinase [Actinosynnema sp. NPDC020468]|uniref:serine/threonine-protein kinase n=1 Tax=Actinosynnema sp. NPDC020468 TaxID=3154488 RepID=UPI0033F6211A
MAEDVFGPYRLLGLLGRGGMGEVYRAYDTAHDRVVALKLLSAVHGADQEYRARFRRESRVVARLREPHVIPIHSFGEIDGRLFLDMRLVEGHDLGDLLARGPLDPARAVRIVAQVADALDAAHADGLVHRDVKPSNVLVTPTDFVYLVDFGIARQTSATATALTASGEIVGTLDYLAPERISQGRVDARTDVYALACVLFTTLTGRRPFEVGGTAAQLWAHLETPPPHPSQANPGVPRALDDVVRRGMAKNPDDRHPTAGALAAAARAALSAPIPAPAPPTASRVHIGQSPAPRPVPPSAPRPARRLVPVVLVLVFAALATAVAILTPSLFDRDEASPSSTTTAPSTTTSAGPSTAAADKALLGALPGTAYAGNEKCRPLATAQGARASVTCPTPNTTSYDFLRPSVPTAEFHLFPTLDALNEFYVDVMRDHKIPRLDGRGGCTSGAPHEYYARFTPEADPGRPDQFLSCLTENGTGVLWWTDSRTLVAGRLSIVDSTQLDALHEWWVHAVLGG